MHINDIVHRDLKINNFVLRGKQVCCFDNDTIGKRGNLTAWAGTPDLLPPAFKPQYNQHDVELDNATKDAQVNAFKKDQLNYFYAMMFVAGRAEYDREHSRFPDDDCEDFVLADLGWWRSASPEAKQLIAFLKDPVNNSLPPPDQVPYHYYLNLTSQQT